MYNNLCSAFGNWKIKKWPRFLNTNAPWQMPIRRICCLTGNRKTKKWRRFLNTIAPWQMPVDTLSAIYKGAVHSSLLLQVKNNGWRSKKSLFCNWQLIPNIFSAHLPILVRYKTKGSVGAVCALLGN